MLADSWTANGQVRSLVDSHHASAVQAIRAKRAANRAERRRRYRMQLIIHGSPIRLRRNVPAVDRSAGLGRACVCMYAWGGRHE